MPPRSKPVSKAGTQRAAPRKPAAAGIRFLLAVVATFVVGVLTTGLMRFSDVQQRAASKEKMKSSLTEVAAVQAEFYAKEGHFASETELLGAGFRPPSGHHVARWSRSESHWFVKLMNDKNGIVCARTMTLFQAADDTTGLSCW
jgi:hypothetical protein